MASNIKITKTDLANSGYGDYDYNVDITSFITTYDDKKTRFLLAIEELLNRYFKDEKFQNMEYDSELASFLLNNHRKFLEDLIEDPDILDRLSEVIYHIVGNSSNLGSVFTGLSESGRDEIISKIVDICNNAIEHIGDSPLTSQSKKYALDVENSLKIVEKKFQKLYSSGDVSGATIKKESSTGKDSEKYSAVPERIISNNPSTNTAYKTYLEARSKTKSLVAQLLSISVMESTKLDSMQRISTFTERRLEHFKALADRLKSKSFIQDSKAAVKLVFMPLKLLTIRFWKNTVSMLKNWYKGYMKGLFKGITKSIFPLESAILQNLSALKKSRLFTFLNNVASTITVLTKKLASRVKMTVWKFLKGFFKILKLPWVFIGLGIIFGKLFQGILNEYIPDESIFKTKEYEYLPLNGNETSIQKLAANKHLGPIRNELLWIDSVLHGVNDFILTIDERKKDGKFAKLFGFNDSSSSEGNSGDSVRDTTYNAIHSITSFFNNFINKMFVGKNSLLSEGIQAFFSHIIDPLRQAFFNADEKYNGINASKMDDWLDVQEDKAFELFSDFATTFISKLGIKTGAAAGAKFASLVPGGTYVKLISGLIGASSGSLFFGSILNSAFKKSEFSKEYESTDKLTEKINREEKLYSEFHPSQTVTNLIEENMRQGEKFSKEDVDRNSFAGRYQQKMESTVEKIREIRNSGEIISFAESNYNKEHAIQLKNIIDTITKQSEDEEEKLAEYRKKYSALVLESRGLSDSRVPEEAKKSIKNRWANFVNDANKDNSTIISPQILSKYSGSSLSYSLAPTKDLPTDGNIRNYIAFRVARLNYINFLIRKYEAGEISSEDFIREFNQSFNPTDAFYQKNENVFGEIKNPFSSNYFTSLKKIAFSENFETSTIEARITKARSQYSYIESFKNIFNNLSKELKDSFFKEIDSSFSKEEAERIKKYIENANLFLSQDFKDFLIENTSHTSLQNLITGIDKDTNILSKLNSSQFNYLNYITQTWMMNKAFSSMTGMSEGLIEKIGNTIGTATKLTHETVDSWEDTFKKLQTEWEENREKVQLKKKKEQEKKKKDGENVNDAVSNVLDENELAIDAMDTATKALEMMMNSRRIQIESSSDVKLFKDEVAKRATDTAANLND